MKVASAVVLAAAAMLACSRPPAESGGQTAQSQGLSRADELLLAAASVALPPAGVTAADLPDPNSTGAQLIAKHCAQCHSLPLPSMHSATDWPSVARRMWLREDGLAASLGVVVPTTSERFLMLEYLTGNALKVSGATLPAGPGRDAFQLVCSRCHALPDPKNHSPQDWPTVFKRMETNMARMKVPPLQGTQTTDILLYLQQASRRP